MFRLGIVALMLPVSLSACSHEYKHLEAPCTSSSDCDESEECVAVKDHGRRCEIPCRTSFDCDGVNESQERGEADAGCIDCVNNCQRFQCVPPRDAPLVIDTDCCFGEGEAEVEDFPGFCVRFGISPQGIGSCAD